MMDGGRKRAGQSHWTGYFLNIGIGAFTGLFVATSAFALYFAGDISNKPARTELCFTDFAETVKNYYSAGVITIKCLVYFYELCLPCHEVFDIGDIREATGD